MKRGIFILLLLTAAAAGIACGEWTCRLPGCRNLLGVLCGRGHLLALARGQGIYEADLERAVAELRYAAGMDDKGRQGEGRDNQAVLDLLVTNAMARSLAAQERVSRTEIERGATLVRCQFGVKKRGKPLCKRAVFRSERFADRSLRICALENGSPERSPEMSI